MTTIIKVQHNRTKMWLASNDKGVVCWALLEARATEFKDEGAARRSVPKCIPFENVWFMPRISNQRKQEKVDASSNVSQ